MPTGCVHAERRVGRDWSTADLGRHLKQLVLIDPAEPDPRASPVRRSSGRVWRRRGRHACRSRAHRSGWGFHQDALRRAARFGDDWIGAGGSSGASFAKAVLRLRAAREAGGRDPARFPISKRVFLAVHEHPEVARAEVERWFTTAYGDPALTDQGGVFGTPDDVGEQLESLVAAGATHLLLNPITRFEEHIDVLAKIVGLA